MQAGVQNILHLGARVISNTVICRSNVEHLPEIAAFIMNMGIEELHFWAFLELGDVGQKAELINIEAMIPPLKKALALCKERGGSATIKWFPRCLLDEHKDCLDNHQPHMFIHNQFQDRLNQTFSFGCPHEKTCTHFRRGCEGIHKRYQELFPMPKLYPSPR